ncbi:MAG: LTA synthase family protein [Paludibacteraceae bacterium]|nr:LTA synthase family protein [Paludibacteraceae bacterium]
MLRSTYVHTARRQWLVFAAFALVVFVKIISFHWFCFHSVILSSLFHHPTEFVRFWLGKITPVVFLSSFIFISKRYWWTVVIQMLIDTWLIANLFYHKAQHLFLSSETMKMAGNLTGVWDSLFSYLGFDIVSFVVWTAIYTIVIVVVKKTDERPKRHLKTFSILFLLSLLFSVVGNYCYYLYLQEVDDDSDSFRHFFPFAHAHYYAKVRTLMDYNEWTRIYIKDYSIVSYFPACFLYNVLHPTGEIISLTEYQEKQVESALYTNNRQYVTPKGNLVIILVESLESWVLRDVEGYNFMPYLREFAHRDNVLYCDKVHAQVRHGNSADGQMIVLTGLLPISNGATCVLYPHNDYPSFAECYNNSIIIKANAGLWNQSIVTYSYHFKQLLEPTNRDWGGDLQLMEKMANYIDTVQQPFCMLGFTMDSHVSFDYGAEHPTYQIPGMPKMLIDYLNCLIHTDACINRLIDKIMMSDLKDNTTIVITGDHTIFRSKNEEIDEYATSKNLPMQTTKTFTPLIIYSPDIKHNIYISEDVYQADIFPTILPYIGLDEFFWHGVGVDVSDSAAMHHRAMTETEAYHMSELIIKSNYFGVKMPK